MATIQARKTEDGERHYRVLIRLKGHPAQTATFKRLADAKRWAQQTETAIRERRYFKTNEAQKRTLAEMVDRYVADVLPARPPQDRVLLTKQLHWWVERLGSFVLADVTPSMIAEQRNRLGKTDALKGRPVTPATRNRYLQALSHAFTVAVREWEWLDENPVRKVRRLREPRGRVRFLSDEERERLLEACQAHGGQRLSLLVLVAISTGARRGELLALRWQDVDLERGLAVLHDTKNRERRALPLTGLALSELERWSAQRRPGQELVFESSPGFAIFPRKRWELVLEIAEIEGFRFHDLRHTAASYLAMSGATLAEIAEVLGHKTLAMVKRYSHLTEAHTAGVVARMNQRFLGPVGVPSDSGHVGERAEATAR